MFNLSKDRQVVEAMIEFNITAINDWLESGGKFEDIDKIEKEWDDDAVIKDYVIDILPVGTNSNAYFHRTKGAVTQNISGYDFLKNTDKGIRYYIDGLDSQIKKFSWHMWRGSIGLKVFGDSEDRLILITPVLNDLLDLERKGKVSESDGPEGDGVLIKVPVSYYKENKPNETLEILRRSSCPQTVWYKNGLASVSFSVLNFEVEY